MRLVLGDMENGLDSDCIGIIAKQGGGFKNMAKTTVFGQNCSMRYASVG